MAFNLTAELNVALNTASLRNAANTINNQLKDVGAVSLGIPKGDADSLKNIRIQAQEASNAMEQFGRQSGLAAKRFVAFTVTAGAIITFTSSLKNALSAAIEFDREMVRLTQVSSEGSGEVSKVAEEVTRLATNYGVSGKQLLNTAVTLKQANLSLKETKQALEALAQAALAPSFDNLKDTTEGAIAIMNQFNISSRDLGGALGSVNAVAAEFAVEAQDLIEGVRKAGGAFRSAGGDLNQFLALFTSIRQTTRESAESIGTGLRTIFARIQRNDTVEALKDIGVQLRYTAEEAKAAGDLGLTNQFVGPYEAIKRLSLALNELRSTDPRFSAIVEELGGYRQISKVIPLVQEFAVSQKALGVAQAGSVSLAQNAAQAQEAFGVKIQKVAEQFNSLVRDITNTSSFRALVDVLLGGASAAIKLAESLKEILPVLTAIAAVKTVQSITSFTKGFASTAFSPPPTNQPSTLSMSPFLPGIKTKKADGGFIKMAKGGFVPGSGRGDKIPALLEPGEYVIPRKFASGGLIQEIILKTKKNSLNDLYDANLDLYNFSGEVQRKQLRPYEEYRSDAQSILNYGKTAYQKAINSNLSIEEATKRANSAVSKAFNNRARGAGGRYDYLGYLKPSYFQTGIDTGSGSQYNQIAGALGEADTQKMLPVFAKKQENKMGLDFAGKGRLYETKVTENQIPDEEIIAKSLLYKGNLKEYKQGKQDQINISNLTVFEAFKKKMASGGLVPGTGNTDSVPLDLPIGSYVIKKSSVNSIGASNLARLGRAKGGTIPALVMPGEYIYNPSEAKNIGISNLDYMNTTGRRRFAAGGSNDPYADLKPKELRIARQVEGQLRIPTTRKERLENKDQAATIAKGITENAQELQRQLGLRKQETNNIQKGLKNQQALDNAAKGLIDTQNQRARILEESKAKEAKERQALSTHVSSAKARATDVSVLTGKKKAAELSGDYAKADVIEKQIQEKTRLYYSHVSKAVAAKERVVAAIETTKLAQDNLNKTSADILKLEERRKRNSEFILKSQESQQAASKQINKLSTEYGMDKSGNITREGKVITSDYGNAYKKGLQERFSQYEKQYGEKPTGLTRKAIREGYAGEIRQGYFNQLQQFAAQRGLSFDEEFASRQSQQMARETVAGRRKLAQNEGGQFYDVGLQNRMERRQAAAERLRNRSFLGRLFGIGPEAAISTTAGGAPKQGIGNRILSGIKGSFSNGTGAFGASIGLGLAATAFDPGSIENYKGREGQFSRKSAVSGALTGAATGAALGSFIPGGAIVGAIAGAALGFVTSLQDANEKITQVKLEESLSKLKVEFENASKSIVANTLPFSNAFKIAQENLDNAITGKALDVGNTFGNKIKTTFGFGASVNEEMALAAAKERKTQYAGQAGNINELLSKQIEANVKSGNFDIKQFLNIKEVEDQIQKLAIGLDKPFNEIKNQFQKFAVDVQRQINFQKMQEEARQAGIKAEQQVVTSLSALADATNAAAYSLNDLSPRFQTASDLLTNNINISPVKRRSTSLESFTFNPEEFKKSISEVSGGLGGFGKTFEKQGNVISAITATLPNVLSQINPKETAAGKDPQSIVKEALQANLKAQGFAQEDISKYINIIVSKMGDDFSKMLNEAGGDFGELAKKLQSGFTDPFEKAFKKITSDFEAAADKYSEGLNRLAQISMQTGQEIDKGSRLRQQTNLVTQQIDIQKEFEKQIKENPVGFRFGEINLDKIAFDKTNIATATSAFGEQQRRLTGLGGGQEFDPEIIFQKAQKNADALLAAQQRFDKAKIVPQGAGFKPEFIDAADQLSKLKIEAANLNNALRNLADQTDNVAAIQGRIAQIEKLIADEREKNLRRQAEVEQTGERLLTSSPEQIQRYQIGANLTNVAQQTGGNLLRFNVEQRKAIFEYLDLMGEEGKKTKSQFLQASGFVAKPVKEAEKKLEPELNNLRNQLLEVFKTQEKAQQKVVSMQEALQTTFFAELKAQNKTFLDQLQANLAILQKGQLEEQNRGAKARQAELMAGQGAVNLFGGLNQDQFNRDVKPQQGNIAKFLDASEQLKNTRSDAAKATNQEFITSLIKTSKTFDELELNLRKNFPTLQNVSEISKKYQVQANTEGLTDFGPTNPKFLTNFLQGLLIPQLNPQVQERRQAVEEAKTALGRGVAGNFAQDLLARGVKAEEFTKAFNEVQRLGGYIGDKFAAEIGNLERASINATFGINKLNQQLNGLQQQQNVPAPQTVQPTMQEMAAANPAAPWLRPLARASGGIVSHSSGLKNADPSFFRPMGSDTIPAILSPGEFVINAKSTAQNLPMLQAINSGDTSYFNKGGPVHLAVGGGDDLGANVALNPFEAQRVALSQRQILLNQAVLTKFGFLRGSWRTNAFNNSIRLQRGDIQSLRNIPYREGAFPWYAFVGPRIKNAWESMAAQGNDLQKFLNASGLFDNMPELSEVKLKQLFAKTKGGLFGMPLTMKIWDAQTLVQLVNSYLNPAPKEIPNFLNVQNPNLDNMVNPNALDRNQQREYYARRANLKPFMEDLLMIGSPGNVATAQSISTRYRLRNDAAQFLSEIESEPLGFATGGQAGSTVPAMLTPGEFVVNAGAAAKNQSLLQRINSGGYVQYRQNGGIIDPGPWADFVIINGKRVPKWFLKSDLEDKDKSQILKQANQRNGMQLSFSFLQNPILAPQNSQLAFRKRGGSIKPQYRAWGGAMNAQKNIDKFFYDLYQKDSRGKVIGTGGYQIEPDKKYFDKAYSMLDMNGNGFDTNKIQAANRFAREMRALDILRDRQEVTADIKRPGETGTIKRSLTDYFKLGFAQAGNGISEFSGVSATGALARSSLQDLPGFQGGAASQGLSDIVSGGVYAYGTVTPNIADFRTASMTDSMNQKNYEYMQEQYSAMQQSVSNTGFGYGGQSSGGASSWNNLMNWGWNSVVANSWAVPRNRWLMATGGNVGASDKVPAMLTPGEFVVNKNAASKVGKGFLEKINGFSKGGPVGYYANGGNVSGGGGADFSAILEAASAFRSSSDALSSSLKSVTPILNSTLQSLNTLEGQLKSSYNSLNGVSGGIVSAANQLSGQIQGLQSTISMIPRVIELMPIAPAQMLVSFDQGSVMQAIQLYMNGVVANMVNHINNAMRNISNGGGM